MAQETLRVKTADAAAALRAIDDFPAKVEAAKQEGDQSAVNARRALAEAHSAKSAVEKVLKGTQARLVLKDDIIGQLRLENRTAMETSDRHVGEGNRLRQKFTKLQTDLSAARAKPDRAAQLSAARAELQVLGKSRTSLARESDQFREEAATLQGRLIDLMNRKNRVSSELAAESTRGEWRRECMKAISDSLTASRKVPDKSYAVFRAGLDREMTKVRTWISDRGARVRDGYVKGLEDGINRLTDDLALDEPPAPAEDEGDGDGGEKAPAP